MLAVEVACSPQPDRRAKRNLTGIFQHWDCMDPAWNPGGLWRGVRIERTGPVRIDRMRVLCRDAEPARANVMVRADLDSDESRTVRIRTTLDGDVERELEHSLAKGTNTVEWTFGVDNPRLWWPRALGDQPLVNLEVDGVGRPRAEPRPRRCAPGCARWRCTAGCCSVNGERLFLKGANVGPTRMALAEATPEELRRDVALAADAGLDLLRVHGHITRPELYEAADELGMLIWQDLPLQWGYARSVGKQAARQAAEAVDLLGHHPSVAIWCGHNEPIALDVAAGRAARRRGASPSRSSPGRSCRAGTARSSTPGSSGPSSGPTAPARSSPTPGIAPAPPAARRHRQPPLLRLVPRGRAGPAGLRRGLAPHGALRQRVRRAGRARPTPSSWSPTAGRTSTGSASAATTPCRRRSSTSGCRRPRYATFAAWQDATQRYQARLLRHHIETLRRLKYRPTGGFCLFSLADAMPAVTWSVLGHDRAAKRAYHVVAEACRPVIVVADRLPDAVVPGEALALDVHVVSDRRASIERATISAVLSWPGGDQGWRWTGDVPADGCVRVGTIQLRRARRPRRARCSTWTWWPATSPPRNRYDSEIRRP